MEQKKINDAGFNNNSSDTKNNRTIKLSNNKQRII